MEALSGLQFDEVERWSEQRVRNMIVINTVHLTNIKLPHKFMFSYSACNSANVQPQFTHFTSCSGFLS